MVVLAKERGITCVERGAIWGLQGVGGWIRVSSGENHGGEDKHSVSRGASECSRKKKDLRKR